MFQGVLGRLLIELAANTARLQSDLGKAVGIVEKGAAKIKTAFKFAGGGLLGAALANTVKQSIEFGDQIAKASAKSGIGAKAMSELAYAAKLADVDVASLSTAIKKMQVAVSEAGSGAKGPIQTFSALGFTLEDIQRRKPEQQFELFAQRISELKDPADRARAATELFGKAGADLLPLFEKGAAGIRKAREEAQKLGLSFSDSDIKRLADADESIKKLDAAWKGFATTLTAKVAPPLTSILNMLSGVDSRSVADKANEEVRALEDRVRRLQSGLDFLPSDQRAELEQQLERARARRDLANAAPISDSGGRRGVRAPRGYAAVAAAEEAEAAAKKAAEAEAKERARALKEAEKARQAHADEILAKNQRRIDAELDYAMDQQRKEFDAAIEKENELAEAQKRIQAQQYQGIRIFKDAFLNAWDDMVNTGKFKWGELLKFMVAEFARRGIVKLLDSVFPTDGSKGGLARGGTVLDGLWKILGFAGGGRPPTGRPSLVGEDGPELFMPDSAGTVVPNGMFGYGQPVTFAPVTHIDARGASLELMRVLPRMLEQNNRRVKAEFSEELRRNRYRL